MNEILAAVAPYFPLVYVLVQCIMYLLIRNDMQRMWIKALDRFVTRKGYVGR